MKTLHALSAVAVLSVALLVVSACVGLSGVLPPSEPPARPEDPLFPAVRILAKQSIADDALAGRRSLAEAAALFRVLNEMPPAVHVPDAAGGGTEEERLCRQVIRVARVRTDPLSGEDLAEAVAGVARLEAEFRTARADGGSIRLPDPSTLTPVEVILNETKARDRAAMEWSRDTPDGWAARPALPPTRRES